MGLFGQNSSSRYWQAQLPLADGGGKPLFISAWVYGQPSSAGILNLYTTANGNSRLGIFSASSLFKFISENNAGTNGVITAAASAPASQWNHILVVERTTAVRSLYINGVFSATNTTSVASPQTLSQISVGVYETTVTALSQQFAEILVCSGNPVSSITTQLAAGKNPLAMGLEIICYYPLRHDLNDYGPLRAGLTSLGNTNPVWSDHPNIEPFRKRRIFRSAVAGITGTLSGTQSAVLSAAGGPIVAGTEASTQSAALSAAGTVLVSGTEASTQSAVLSAAGGVLITGTEAGTQSATLSAYGGPIVTGSLSGTQSAVLSAAGGNVNTGVLSGTQSATLAATAGVVIGGTEAGTQAATLTGAGGVLVGGAEAGTQISVLSAAGGPIVAGGLTATQSAAIAAAGQVFTGAHLSASQSAVLSATGTVSAASGITGTLNKTQSAVLTGGQGFVIPEILFGRNAIITAAQRSAAVAPSIRSVVPR